MPTVTVSDVRIPYLDEGAGPVVVLVHGAFVDGRLWRAVTPLLRGSFRVVVPDLPLGAHAGALPHIDLSPPAQADLLVGFLDALDLRGVTLVGNDTGGGICQIAVARAPQRAARLVLTNADAYSAFPPRALRPLCALARRAPAVVDLLLRGLRQPALRTAFALPAWRRPEEALLAAWMERVGHDPGLRADGVRILAGMTRRHHDEVVAVLRRCAPPTLVAWAPGDLLFPMAIARQLVAELPGARLLELERGRAFTPLEQPTALAGAVAAFASESYAS